MMLLCSSVAVYLWVIYLWAMCFIENQVKRIASNRTSQVPVLSKLWPMIDECLKSGSATQWGHFQLLLSLHTNHPSPDSLPSLTCDLSYLSGDGGNRTTTHWILDGKRDMATPVQTSWESRSSHSAHRHHWSRPLCRRVGPLGDNGTETFWLPSNIVTIIECSTMHYYWVAQAWKSLYWSPMQYRILNTVNKPVSLA